MGENLQPGTITTLGALRPGDVGCYVIEDAVDPMPFLVGEQRGADVYVQYPDQVNSHYGSRSSPARYLGPGRVEPARIVMEGKGDRIAELEAQVKALREELRYAIEIAVQRSDPPLSEQVFKDARAVLAATAPKEKPCTT